MKRIMICLLTAVLCWLTACGDAADTAGDTESSAPGTTHAAEQTMTVTEQTTTSAAKTTTVSQQTTAPAALTTTTTAGTAALTSTAEGTDSTDPGGMRGERIEDSGIIPPGLWTASRWSGEGDGLRRIDTYYEIHADGTGIMLHQENGLTETFRYTFKDSVLGVIPDSGAAMYTADVDFYAADGLTVKYKFQYGGAAEDWQYKGDSRISSLKLFSNARLCEMARAYYNVGGDPQSTYAEAVIDDSDMIEIVLYEQSVKDQPLQTYTVDRTTAQGHDWDYEPIDLNRIPAAG